MANDLQNIQKVFGQDWTPTVSQDLQNKGVYGAVRVTGSNDVYTIGSGGTKLTPETYKDTFGTYEQNGIVGEINPDQAAALGINLNSTSPTQVTDTLKSSLLNQQSVTSSDITNLINQRKDLYNQIQNANTPSQEVTDLQNQYANLDQQISDVQNSANMGKVEAGQRVIPMDAIYGEQQAIEQRAQAKLDVLNGQQKNLLVRLGFAKDAQDMKTQTLKDLMSYTTDNLNIQLKMQDRIDKQITDYQTRLDKQSADTKDEINNIVTLFSKTGKDFNDLSDADKTAIIQKATTAGLDINLIQYGLKAAKDQYLYDQNTQQQKDILDMQAQKANIAQSYASIANANKGPASYQEWSLAGGVNGTGKTYSEWLSSNSSDSKISNTDRVNAINQGLKENNAFGGDKKVSYETYNWMLQNWVNNGGTENEFYANYPKTQYLDDNNRYLFDSQK